MEALPGSGGRINRFDCQPLLLVISLGERMALGRPVFFRQKRPGRDGRPFTIYKFSTMVEPDFRRF